MVTIFTPGGSAGLDLLELRLDALDHLQRVLALPHDDDAGDDVARAVQIGDAAPQVGAERDRADVAHADRARRSSLRASTISPMSAADCA